MASFLVYSVSCIAFIYRNKGQKLISCFLTIQLFVGHLFPFYCICTASTKIDFGWPYVEIGLKMADGWMLFKLVLHGFYVWIIYLFSLNNFHCVHHVHNYKLPYMWKVSNQKSFIDYWVKEYSEENFCSESFHNKWHILYIRR